MPDPGASLALMWMDPATGETRKVPLDHALRLGSNRQQNDVALPFAGVEALHAEIVSRPGGGWEIAPVGVLRLKVDGAMVPRAELRPGSTFSIGILDFTVGYAGASPEPAGAAARPAATVSGSSRILVPPPVRRPAVAGPRPPEPDRRLASALLGGGLVALLAAGVWFAILRPKAAGPPGAAPASKLAATADTATTPVHPTKPVEEAADPFAAAKKSVVTVIAKLAFEKGFATGTGFFVTSSGKLVTNFHVVKRTDYQQILMPGSKKPIDARILASDEEHDLALLQAMVDPPVPVAPLAASALLKMGDPVFALGSPAGPVLEMSLSRGIVSSDKLRQFGDVALIQHDASINPGNSGGPLLDQQGRVVGVNTLKIKETQGLNFAIPVDQVKDFLALPR
ncbi:MAG: trypsin-like peptidase domain-containing protein [Acidobacteriota bacterium]